MLDGSRSVASSASKKDAMSSAVLKYLAAREETLVEEMHSLPLGEGASTCSDLLDLHFTAGLEG